MKICFITPSTGTTQGGVETTVLQFAGHLSAKHDITLITGRSGAKPMKKEVTNAPYEVITAPFWPRFTPKNRMLTRFVPRLDPYKTESLIFYYHILLRGTIKKRIADMDVISTHYRLDSKLFSNLASRLGVPSVFHILGGAYHEDFFAVDKSTLYVATSHDTKRRIRESQGIEIEDVVTPGIPSRVLSRKRENVPEKRLLFVGRIQESKGIFELMDIFSELLKTDGQLHLVVVGEGELLPRLKERARTLRLSNSITFTGSLSNEKLFEHYFNSTLFIFPTKAETFGLVPLEAMACGLPVITSELPALRESTGGNAVLLSPDNKGQWVDSIKTLLESPDKRDELSAKGVAWAKEFTWEKKAEEYEAVLIKAKNIFEKR